MGNERKAGRIFSLLKPQRWPRTWTLGSHYAAGTLGQGSVDEYLARCLPWERLTLEQHRKMLHTVRSQAGAS